MMESYFSFLFSFCLEEKVNNLSAHLEISCLGVINFSLLQNSIEHILKVLFLLL